MKSPHLYLLPLLFLPNLGLARETAYGVLEISDYLIWLYLGLLVLTVRSRRPILVHQLRIPVVLFFGWAILSTLTINIRFGYTHDYYITFGLLKIAKMALYVIAGYLTCVSLQSRAARVKFEWSLVAAGVVVSVGIITSTAVEAWGYQHLGASPGYKAANAVSLTVAMLFCSVASRWALGYGSRWWRIGARVGLVLMLVGMAASRGRGGWLAASVGLAYLAYRRGWRRQVAAALGIVGVAAVVSYCYMPSFRSDVKRTFDPDPRYLKEYEIGLYGVDEGGRVATWRAEAPKIVDHPVMGTGVFHRGGRTRCWTTGSHNFWLQMFLETGVVGGCLVLITFGLMWRHTSRALVADPDALATQAALVTAFVGGLGGEYFYGGMALFTLIFVYATVGSLPGWLLVPRVSCETESVLAGPPAT